MPDVSPWNQPLPTQAQLNSYFTQPGANPWAAMGPPRSTMQPPSIDPAASANNASPDELDRLAAMLKAKQAQLATAAGVQPVATGLPPGGASPGSPPGLPPTQAATPAGGQNVPRGAMPAGRQDVQGIMGQMDQASLDALKAQGLTVDQIKQRLAGLQTKDLPVDYRPLAGLADSWFGSHLASVATPIETAQQRQEQISKLQDAVLKGQQSMSSDELGMLKTKLQTVWHEDEVQSRLQQHQEQMASQAAYRDALLQNNKNKFDTGEFDKATKAFNGDATVVDAMKKRDEISTFKAQVATAQQNPIAANTLPMSLVRLYVNRVSQAELGGAKGAQDMLDRAEQIGQTMTKGTLSDTNAKWMQGLATDLEQRNNANLQDHIERHAATYSTASGMPKDKAADAISGGLYGQVKTAAGPSEGEKAQAKAWLADPKNAKDPMRAQVQALVQ